MPRAGWWGFAALIDGPAAKAPDGKPAKTELGGLIWVKATDMAPAAPAVTPAMAIKPAE
jgi:cobalt/nickel transport protein